MKKILYLLATLLLSTVVFAQSMMDFTGGFGVAHKSGKGCLFGLLYFIIGSFIFSAIFWLTYNWLAKKKK